MTMNVFNLNAGRIAKFKGQILAHAIPVEVLGTVGQQVQMPEKSSDTIVFRRWLPFGGTAGTPNQFFQNGAGDRGAAYAQAALTQEGVTPPPDSLVPQDITAVLNQYGVLYGVTDKTVALYEDDVPAEMIKQVGERVGLIREMVRYGQLRGCTNQFYGGSGSSRVTVNGAVTLNMLRKMTRSLRQNHAKFVRQILAAAPEYATTPVEAAFVVFGHTDLEQDFRDLPGFKHVAEYGSRKVISEYELGSVENFRIVLSPDLPSIQDAGAAIGSLGLQSTSGTLIDVYPMIVTGEDAFGQVMLRGGQSLDPTYIPPKQKDKNDPLGQRGYIGTSFWMQGVVLNNGWMAVGNVGAKQLN
jgi:N4-gp56 family major capsid protein